ncbi:hypothetical protein ABZ990_19470 [Streptomyces sp. NPDC046203]|uniref:phage tail protein n=1 Tax=Streptomyces sp. NPDC046203 TaxID=3154602 RepID=UPI0033EFCC77
MKESPDRAAGRAMDRATDRAVQRSGGADSRGRTGGLAPHAVQRLQGAAGNAAVARLVAQRYTAPVKTSAAQAPGFRRVKADVAAKKTRLSVHAPAAAESKSAQDAAVAPPDDKEAQGKAANAEKMNAAKPGEFDKEAFVAAVDKAIEAQAPKNLDEADKFADSGKADKVKGEVDGKVSDGKDASAKDIDTATKAAPDTSAAKDKPVTPMTPDHPPGNPGAPSAADAIPAKQPASVTDFSQGPAGNDKAMADADVTEEQLARGNEPAFDHALKEKKTAEADSAKAPAKGRAAEDRQLAEAKAGAAASGTKAVSALAATRTAAGKSVDGGKGETKSKDEKRRAAVTAKLQNVFDTTKRDVEKILGDLDKKVDVAFAKGEKGARDAFMADQKARMKTYKDKRYSGFWGKGRWLKDKFAGLPEEANQLYQKSRELYVARMRTVISSIADLIGVELGKAKARIAKGRTELKAEVDKLPADLRQYGEEAAKDFAGKFEDLEATIDEKSEQLVQDLANFYTAALKKIDEEITKLQEANKGIMAKAKDAIVGAVKTINELKNLLLGILAKAASAIVKIIKDPIGFLGKLVKAVGGGLHLFITNVADHLKKGLVSWLLGTAPQAGLDIPQKFDIKGIIRMLASLLGLTWESIRVRITRKGVPEQALSAVESSVPIAGKLAREGPAGAVKEIEEEAGDLKSTILSKLTEYLVPTVVVAGITWILSLLNPASAFVRAVKGIIDIVTFIVNQGAQIVEFVNAVLDAVVQIANGGQAGVPKMVETALAASIPLLIGFLASLLGIGSLANKVKSVFHTVSRPVNRAIDKIVGFIVQKGKALWQKLKGKKGEKSGKNGKKGGKDGEREADSLEAKNERLGKAMAAAVRAMDKYAGKPVASAVLRPVLAAIRTRYRLKELVSVPDGERWAVRGRINPERTEVTPALHPRHEMVKRYLPLYGNRFIIEPSHSRWLSRQINRTKLYEDDVLRETVGSAREYLRNPQTVKAVYEAHFDGEQNFPSKGNSYKEKVFSKGSVFREALLKALGEGRAVDVLRAKGLEKSGQDQEARGRLEAMNFLWDGDLYGAFKPFPDGKTDPDPDLKAAVLASRRGTLRPLLAFLHNMVEFGESGDRSSPDGPVIDWSRFNELWRTHSDSVNWLKDRFRDLDSGKHEWIPTNYLREVLEAAIGEKNRGNLDEGLKWVYLHHTLRSSTNTVLWRIVGPGGGKVDPGGHVGSFYEAYKNKKGETKYKSTLTNGTGDFHDELRSIFNANRDAGPERFLSALQGKLSDLVWDGDVSGLPMVIQESPIGALYHLPSGEKKEMTVAELGEQQRENYRTILNDFRNGSRSVGS